MPACIRPTAFHRPTTMTANNLGVRVLDRLLRVELDAVLFEPAQVGRVGLAQQVVARLRLDHVTIIRLGRATDQIRRVDQETFLELGVPVDRPEEGPIPLLRRRVDVTRDVDHSPLFDPNHCRTLRGIRTEAIRRHSRRSDKRSSTNA